MASCDQISRIYVEGISQFVNYHDRRIAQPALDPADIGLMEVCTVGQLLLAEASTSTHALQVESDALLPIHKISKPA